MYSLIGSEPRICLIPSRIVYVSFMSKKSPKSPVERLERPLSLGAQVEQALRRAIGEGVFADGRLPTEVELAEQFGVSRETVRRAAETLQQEGLLRKYRRRGTVIESAPPELSLAAPPTGRLLAYIQAAYPAGGGEHEGVMDGAAALMFEGAAEEASRADYDLLYRTVAAAELRATIDRLVRRHRIAGLIAASFAEEKALRRFGGRELPVVLLDHDLALPKTSSIRDDSAAGSRSAVEHLVELGHRRIALAHWHRAELNPWRVRGYREALRAAKLGVRRAYELSTEITAAGARRIVDQIAALEPRPTALVCFNNTLARHVVEAAAKQGLRVPDDLSIVGLGGEAVPTLTCCQSDWRTIGRRAAAMLVRRLDAGPTAATIEHEQPPPTLHVGMTTRRID
jgi:DNA-binding LacI/PurR family transcriptional regulator